MTTREAIASFEHHLDALFSLPRVSPGGSVELRAAQLLGHGAFTRPYAGDVALGFAHLPRPYIPHWSAAEIWHIQGVARAMGRWAEAELGVRWGEDEGPEI